MSGVRDIVKFDCVSFSLAHSHEFAQSARTTRRHKYRMNRTIVSDREQWTVNGHCATNDSSGYFVWNELFTDDRLCICWRAFYLLSGKLKKKKERKKTTTTNERMLAVVRVERNYVSHWLLLNECCERNRFFDQWMFWKLPSNQHEYGRLYQLVQAYEYELHSWIVVDAVRVHEAM